MAKPRQAKLEGQLGAGKDGSAYRVTSIDKRGIWFDGPLMSAVSLLVAGDRIWSFVPAKHARLHDDGFLVAWPSVTLPYIDGVGEFAIRRLDTGEELYADTVRIGDQITPIRILGSDDMPLAIDKGGHLKRNFGVSDEARKRELVEAMQSAVELLESVGAPAFVAFGCLLGAVREGKLIGHDNDGDIVYLARSTHPFDLIVESFELERVFIDHGWRVRRLSGGDFKLLIPLSDGELVGCDVFTAWFRAGELLVMPSIRGKIPVDDLLPTRTMALEGVDITVPRRPESLLEATYGPSWRVPDPSFSYAPSRSTRRLMSGFLRGERRHYVYWEDFYMFKAASVPSGPSSFATWVADREPDRGTLVDIGSGTGRDSLWLSEQGFSVVGCDYAPAAVSFARRIASERDNPAEFARLNLYDIRDVLASGASLARGLVPNVVYARFVIHAIEELGRRNLWVLSRSALRASRGRIYLEFRTEPTDHTFGEHYRQFVRPETVTAELHEYGFDIEYCEERQGLAVHKDEDPMVCRIVARMR